LRRALLANARAFRRVLSVRHRALWLSRIGDFAEAELILGVARTLLCCESIPCPVQQVDAWLPIHARTLALLDGTRGEVLRLWHQGP
jgi:hypothetical protein